MREQSAVDWVRVAEGMCEGQLQREKVKAAPYVQGWGAEVEDPG